MGHILREDKEEPTRKATFEGSGTIPDLGDSRRVGRNRNHCLVFFTISMIANKSPRTPPIATEQHVEASAAQTDCRCLVRKMAVTA